MMNLKSKFQLNTCLAFSFLILSLNENALANERRAPQSVDAEVMYVQAVKAPLRKAPQAGSESLLEIKRGDKVQVKKTEGLWHFVSVSNKEGWISKLMLAQHPPIGAASLSQEVDQKSLEQQSRARPRARAESVATTRNLTADSRARVNQDAFRKNLEAVEYLKTLQIPGQELDNFVGSANLKR